MKFYILKCPKSNDFKKLPEVRTNCIKLVKSLNEQHSIITSCPKYGLSTPSRWTDVYDGLLCTKHSSRYKTTLTPYGYRTELKTKNVHIIFLKLV